MGIIYGNKFYKEPEITVNITPEQIQKISEFCMSIDIDTSEVLIESGISKLKLKNEDKINRSIELFGKEITDTIKQKGINKSVISEIGAKLKDFYTDIAELISYSDIPGLEIGEYDLNKIRQAWVLVFFTIVINTLFSIVLYSLFGNVGRRLTIWVCAPLVEESAKQISIRGKFATEFAALFNMYEFSSYVSNMVIRGIDPVRAIKVRLFPVFLHLSTTIIQYISNNKELLNKLNINVENEEDSNAISFIGNVIALLIHGTWNYLCIYSLKFNMIIDKLTS